MFKRIGLFLITNLAILLVLSFTARILGVDRFLTANGLDLSSLFVFAALFGFGGAFISLAISKWSAKRMVGAQVIENPSNATEMRRKRSKRCRDARAAAFCQVWMRLLSLPAFFRSKLSQ